MRSTIRSRPRSRLATLAALVAATTALGACGGEDDDDAPVEVIGAARLVDAPPTVELETRTVMKSVPVNALAGPAPVPVAPPPARAPVAPAALPTPEPVTVSDPAAPVAVAPAVGGAAADDAAPIPATDPDADAGAGQNIEAAPVVDADVDAAAEAVVQGAAAGEDVDVPVAETDESIADESESATAMVAGRSGETPAATVATSIDTVVIAPEATVGDVAAVAGAVGAGTAAPVEADTLIAETGVTPSVPDNTSDNAPWNSLVSDWTGSVALLRRRFGEDLDEAGLLATEGDRNQVVSLMENRLGIDRAEAESRLDDFARSPDGS